MAHGSMSHHHDGDGPSHKGHKGGFHRGGALKKAGHHGLMKHGKAKSSGHLLATPSNVGSLGHKAGK